MDFWKKLEANAYWGYRALIAQPLKRLFQVGATSGVERFLANYGSEGLLPLTEADRQVLRGASRCIHCGICDAFGPESRGSFQGASYLATAYSRATPHLTDLEAALAGLAPKDLERAEALC